MNRDRALFMRCLIMALILILVTGCADTAAPAGPADVQSGTATDTKAETLSSSAEAVAPADPPPANRVPIPIEQAEKDPQIMCKLLEDEMEFLITDTQPFAFMDQMEKQQPAQLDVATYIGGYDNSEPELVAWFCLMFDGAHGFYYQYRWDGGVFIRQDPPVVFTALTYEMNEFGTEYYVVTQQGEKILVLSQAYY